MEVVLRKCSKSVTLSVSPEKLNNARLMDGKSLTITCTPAAAITLAPKRKYSLQQLLVQCDLKAAPPRDLALWCSSRPAGHEVW